MLTNLYFFTATILEWHHILKNDNYKDIIISSLTFLVAEKRVKVYAYVIMPNHIHLVWKFLEPHIKSDVQRDFMKYTAQKIKAGLKSDDPELLEKFCVNSKDRQYQIWQRDPLSIELISVPVVNQKIDYIHSNPINPKWVLGNTVTDYRYSSGGFYYLGMDEFGFLTNIGEEYF